MDTIKLYERNTEESARLEMACVMFNHLSNGTIYTVEDTYFDYGQKWMWTTIVAHKDGEHWQCLSPRDHEQILTRPDIIEAVKEITSGKWWYNP